MTTGSRNGILVSYNDAERAKAIVSFTAVNASGDTYVFKNNILTENKIRKWGSHN